MPRRQRPASFAGSGEFDPTAHPRDAAAVPPDLAGHPVPRALAALGYDLPGDFPADRLRRLAAMGTPADRDELNRLLGRRGQRAVFADDTATPGEAGDQLDELAERAVEQGVDRLAALVRAGDLSGGGSVLGEAGRRELAAGLAAVLATADLLARVRVLRLADRQRGDDDAA